MKTANTNPKKAKRQKAAAKSNSRHTLPWAALAAALTLTTLIFDTGLVDASNVVRFTVMALLLALLSLAAYRQRERIAVGRGGALLLLFLIFTWCSLAWATNRSEALYEAARWGVAGALMAHTYILFRKKPMRALLWFSRASLVVFVVSIGVAFLQIWLAGDMRWDSRYCVSSLYTHKGTFCLMLILMATFPLMRLMSPLRRGRWVYMAMLIAAAGMVLFLQSRSALIALATSLMAAALFWLLRKVRIGVKGRMGTTLMLATALGTVIVFGSRQVVEMRLPDSDNARGILSNASIHERQALWAVTFRMIEQQPIGGCGAGNWKVCHPSVSVKDVFSIDVLDFTFVRPHNEYLRILSELGWVGFILLMLMTAHFFTTAVISTTGRNGKVARVGASILAGVAAFAAFDFPTDRTETLCWIFIVAGSVAAFASDSRHRTLTRRVWPCLTAIMLATSLLGIVRWHSERQQIPIRKAIHTCQWERVEALCQKARSPFATLTNSGMPYAYYEAMAQEYLHRPALSTLRKAHNDTPYSKQVLCDLGRLEYTVQHNTTTAIALLNEAIRISPLFSYSYYNLAQIYLQEGCPERAAQVLKTMNLEEKQKKIDRWIWQYHQGEDVRYYQEQLVPAERAMRDQMLTYCQKKDNATK